MDLLQTSQVQCPGCGEIIEVLIDTSIGDQEYVEDCQVCCEPMIITVSIPDPENVNITAVRENP